jgi:hypothetical protein
MCVRARGDLPDQDPGREFADREVKLATTTGGAGVLHGDLTAGCAAAVAAVPDTLAAPAGAEDDRIKGQRYHDAFQEAMSVLGPSDVSGSPSVPSSGPPRVSRHTAVAKPALEHGGIPAGLPLTPCAMTATSFTIKGSRPVRRAQRTRMPAPRRSRKTLSAALWALRR